MFLAVMPLSLTLSLVKGLVEIVVSTATKALLESRSTPPASHSQGTQAQLMDLTLSISVT